MLTPLQIVILLLLLLQIIWFIYATVIKRIYKKRKLNAKALRKLTSFVAIDFETMNEDPTSACSIAAVKYINGLPCGQMHSLIRPVGIDKAIETSPTIDTTNPQPEHETDPVNSRFNKFYHIHHISIDDVKEYTPTFDEIYPTLVSFVGDLPIVAHNAVFDIDVLESCRSYYEQLNRINLPVIYEAEKYYTLLSLNLKKNIICTCALKGWIKLKKCCEQCDIPLDRHHNAMCDAQACAELYLNYIQNLYERLNGDIMFLMLSDLAVSNYVHVSTRLQQKYKRIVNKFPYISGGAFVENWAEEWQIND